MRLLTLLASLTLALPCLAQTEIGSPTINRALNDSASGFLYLYLGGTQPSTAPGEIVEWSFFDDDGSTNGQRVTPFLCEQTGPSSWTVVAVGTSRASTASGVQTHPFATLVGNAVMERSKSYTVGFIAMGYTLNGTTLTPTSSSSGVVDFDGYNNFSDRWAYAQAPLALGLILGTGGAPLDSMGSGGRIYSARFRVQRVVSVPGCPPPTNLLVSREAALVIGAPFTLELRASNISNGAYLLWIGFPAVTRQSSCGLPLPGLGDFLIFPGSQITLVTGAINSRAVPIPLAVPNDSSLTGAVLMFQALTADLAIPRVPLELTNGLWAMLVR
ncbi:MAG: hypothetical protein IPN34_21755 [Planctomycetes bacterium]|nr:hypothetical protein [Planctomycetota bacterium]